MHHLVAATKNPAKIRAIHQAFELIFGSGSCHIDAVDAQSHVPEQPLGSEQTRLGARNRVLHAKQLRPQADFWIAIEAGIEDDSTFSWIVIEHAEKRSEARSASLPLPPPILNYIHAGSTLGDAMSQWSGITQIGRKEGAIGLFSAGKLTRSDVYRQAIVLALSPFHNAIYD